MLMAVYMEFQKPYSKISLAFLTEQRFEILKSIWVIIFA